VSCGEILLNEPVEHVNWPNGTRFCKRIMLISEASDTNVIRK
jgi:hypothetical protein